MDRRRLMRISIATLCGMCALMIVASGAADAKGIVVVQQHNGPVQQYNDVNIVILDNTALKITSADGVGTLVINKAACSYVGELQMCLPYTMTLDQGGGTHPLDFERGTVYVNLTDMMQPLALSSTQLPPRGILLSIRTKVGTIVNMSGTIDKVEK
jgi:hypothetical protein